MVERTNTPQLQHKVLKRDFILSVPSVAPGTDPCLVNTDPPLAVTPSSKNNNRLLHIPDTEGNEERKSVSQLDPVEPISWESLHVAASTFPRRSQRLLTGATHKIVQQRQSTASENSKDTPKTSKFTKKRAHEYYSEDGSPPWKRIRRFMMENLNENPVHVPPNINDEQPGKRIEALVERLKYYEDLVQFYKNSKYDDEKKISELEAQCKKFIFQLEQEQAANKKLIAEVAELKAINEKLYAEMTCAIDKKRPTQTPQDILASVLQPYFTAGQIRCIVYTLNHVFIF